MIADTRSESYESLLMEVEHLRAQNRELIGRMFVMALLVEREPHAEGI